MIRTYADGLRVSFEDAVRKLPKFMKLVGYVLTAQGVPQSTVQYNSVVGAQSPTLSRAASRGIYSRTQVPVSEEQRLHLSRQKFLVK